MKNKTLAIFGIGTYILSVLSSATDLEGNLIAPIVLVAISGIATAIFIIMAVIRLWKKAMGLSITLAVSNIALIILTAIFELVTTSYGFQLIYILNITEVIQFIAFIWAVVKLFQLNNIQIADEQK